LIVTKNALIDMKRHLNNIVFEGFQLTPSENPDEFDLKVKLFSDHADKTRLHGIAFQFMPGDSNFIARELNNMNKEVESKIIPKIKSRNTYLSNKTLGDEYRYVLERKK
jgi:hypothetical protein